MRQAGMAAELSHLFEGLLHRFVMRLFEAARPERCHTISELSGELVRSRLLCVVDVTREQSRPKGVDVDGF